MFPSLVLAALLCSGVTLATSDDRLSTSSVPLYHRLISPTASSHAPYVLRGLLHLDALQDEAWLEETGTGVESLVSPAFAAGASASGADERYQIAIGELDTAQVIAIDSCILYHPPTTVFNETLALSLSSLPFSEISGFRYSTSGKGSRAACGAGVSREGLERGAGRLGGSLDVKVERGWTPEPIRFSQAEGSDASRPVVVDKDGKIVPPPPEKSFIAKYGLYIAPVLIILLMTGGEEPAAAGAAK